MYATRLVQLLIVAVSILGMAQAAWWNSPKIHRTLVRRAKDAAAASPSDSLLDPLISAGATTSPAAASPTADTSSSEKSSAADSSTSSPSPSSPSPSPSATDSDSSTSSADSSTSASPSASATPTSPTDSTSSTSSSSSSSQQATQTSAASSTSASDSQSSDAATTTSAPAVSTSIQIIVKTNSDGSKVSSTSSVLVTNTAALSSGDSGSTSGMSTKTRNTIIGVVVGVGGAFVLGALGLVAFRIWGRRKHAEEADGLMDYGAELNTSVEKSPRGSSAGGPQRNPFQSTLENYHQPTNVNASSNF